MQGGLSFSTPLRSYFPFLVWDSMRQVMKGRWGSRIWSCWGREGFVSSGPLWSWVTGLTQQLAFLSWCFASSFECRRDGGGTVAGFLCPSIRKGTDPSREGMFPPVLLNLILRSESGKEQRLVGKVGDTSRGRDAANAEKQGANGIPSTEHSGAFGIVGRPTLDLAFWACVRL